MKLSTTSGDKYIERDNLFLLSMIGVVEEWMLLFCFYLVDVT